MISTRVDLRQTEILVINLPEDTARRQSIADVCGGKNLRYRLVEAVKTTPGQVGCALGHLRALKVARPGAPVLVLEDDVVMTEHFRPVIDIPADADAVYLGVSAYAALELIEYLGFTKMLAAEPVSEDIVRVYNMLSAHAILYISEAFKQAVAEQIIQSMTVFNWQHDRRVAIIQGDYKVYAYRRPLFYQAGHLQRESLANHQEETTNIELELSPAGSTASVLVPGGDWRAAILVKEDGCLRWRWS